MWWLNQYNKGVCLLKNISKTSYKHLKQNTFEKRNIATFRLFKNIGNYFSNHVSEFLFFSIILNVITALIKLYFGIMIPSYLFGINAGYYIVLCVARVLLLYKLNKLSISSKISEDEKLRKEVQVYGNIGSFTILLGLMYFVSCIQLYNSDENVVYSGYIVYYVALVAFTKFIMAIYGKRIHKRLHMPIMAALKQISFSDALVSIVVTECTLLVLKGNSQANKWSSYLGILVSGVILIQGIMMVFKSRKLLIEG